MEKIVIHKNKSETFTCHLKADGATLNNAMVRLCLEFNDNRNMFFHGQVNPDGNCKISLPALTDIPNKTAKLSIEAVVDSVYFKLFEADAEIKNSVELEMVQLTTSKEQPKAKISFSGLKRGN